MNREENFTDRVKRVIKSIPEGKVASYGQVAAVAGNHRGARQVVRVLHSSSRKDNLPWYRVINSKGTISLPPGHGYEEQKQLLLSEGVRFDEKDRVNLELFLWRPGEEKQ